MDLAQLLAELLRLMASTPDVVKVNGPSDAVQAAQVAGAIVAGLALIVTSVGLGWSVRHNNRALRAAKEQSDNALAASEAQHEKSMSAAREQHKAALRAADQSRFQEAARSALGEAASALQSYMVANERRRLSEPARVAHLALARQVSDGMKIKPADFDAEADRVEKGVVVHSEVAEVARLKTNLLQLYFPASTQVGAAVGVAFRMGFYAGFQVGLTGPDPARPSVAEAMDKARESLKDCMEVIGQFARGEIQADAPAPQTTYGEPTARLAGPIAP